MLADADRLADARLTTIVLTLVGVLSAAFLIGPRASPASLAALAFAPLAWASAAELRDRARDPALAFIVALVLGVYLLLSVAWAADRSEAINKVALFFAFVGAVWVACAAATVTSDRVLERLLVTVLIAVAIGLAYLCFEELTQHALKRLLFNLVPATRIPERHMGVSDDGTIERVRAYASNRNMAALVLVLWPSLLAAQSVLAEKRGQAAALCIFAITALTIGLSQHDTSLVALVASLAVFGLSLRWPRPALVLVAAGWLVATLLVVPIVSYTYRDASLHLSTWLPHTARQRIILWGYTAEQVGKSPWVGVGIASTKALDSRRTDVAATPVDHVYPLRTGPHAHNVYLQTWYELGVIGALLLSALGLALLRSISRLPQALLPYALASFVTAAVVGAFSWGMWQAWFMAAFAIASVLTVTSLELAARRGSGKGFRRT
jgi:O-antigen ligase